MPEFELPVELQAAVKRDWGQHYKRYEKWSDAISSFNESIELNPNAVYYPLLEKISCELKTGDLVNALEDIEKCLELYPNDLKTLQRKIACLYDLNRLEDALSCAYNTCFLHPKDSVSKSFIDILTVNLKSAVGFEANPILRTLEKSIQNKTDNLHSERSDERPKWIILKEKGESDVISLMEKADVDAMPFNKYKKEVEENMRHKVYFNDTVSEHIGLWKRLKANQAVNLSQTPISSKKLMEVIERNLSYMKNYENMLWTRQPLFFKRAAIRKQQAIKTRAHNLDQLKKITDFSAKTQLDKIKKLAKTDFGEMLRFVEQIMTEFYSIKTQTILPRKSNYITEIYTIIGNEYLHRLKMIPSNVMNAEKSEERLKILLKLPSEKKMKDVILPTSKTFGDPKYFQDPEAFDRNIVFLQEKTAYFKKRLKHSRFDIEKSYLYYELSRIHLLNRKFEDSQQYARDSALHGNQCNNTVWMFLSYLNIVRCDAGKKNYLRVTRNLKHLTKIAEELSSLTIVFVRTIKRINEDIELEKGLQRRQRGGSVRTHASSSRNSSAVEDDVSSQQL